MPLKMDWKWFIGILVTIMTTLLPFIFSNGFFQKDKQISYEILQTLNKKTLNALNNESIVYGIKNGSETYIAENLSIYTIRFVNSGKIAIQRSEFDTPINIKLDHVKKIFQPQINFVKPKNLLIDYKVLSNSIQITPMLLNPNDEFTITLILDGKIDNIIPSARIVGVTELTPILQTKKRDVSYLQLLLGIAFLIYFAKFLSFVMTDARNSRVLFYFYLPAIAAIESTSLHLIQKNLPIDINKWTFAFSFMLILFILLFLFHFIFSKKASAMVEDITERT
ncbi:MAG: hypothetical protein WC680_03205 [Sulfuricurvum sp.]|jgi:hypothetical protein